MCGTEKSFSAGDSRQYGCSGFQRQPLRGLLRGNDHTVEKHGWNGQKCKGGVICNYQAPVTEGGKLEVKPSKLVYTDAEEMTKNSVSVTLQYPNGAAPAAGEQITADWYYTTDTPDGLKKLHPLAETNYSMDTNGLTSSSA